MHDEEKDRIKFYSVNDLSTGLYVDKIEKYVLATKSNISINDFFEIYNIELFFDKNFYPKKWSDTQKREYTKKIKDIYEKLKQEIFIQNMNDDNFQTIFKTLNFDYKGDFWKLFNDYKLYKNIKNDVFKDFLESQSIEIKNILSYENIVKFFNIAIKEFLLQYENSAEIIIDYEESKNIFLPKSLTNNRTL